MDPQGSLIPNDLPKAAVLCRRRCNEPDNSNTCTNLGISAAMVCPGSMGLNPLRAWPLSTSTSPGEMRSSDEYEVPVQAYTMHGTQGVSGVDFPGPLLSGGRSEPQ